MSNVATKYEKGLLAATLFERWKSSFTREQITEIENKYMLSPEGTVISDHARQRSIGEAVKLIYEIHKVDGDDLTNMNMINAMRYFLVAIDSQKYRLDVKFARDDNCIEELAKHYGLKK